MLLLIIIARGLLDRPVCRLTHSIHKRDPITSGLGHKARSQSVGAELSRIKSSHPAALLENEVDRLRGQRIGTDGAVLANLPEDRPGGNVGGLHPLVQG